MSVFLSFLLATGISLIPLVSACERDDFMVCDSKIEEQSYDHEGDIDVHAIRLYSVHSSRSDVVYPASAGDTEVIAMYGTIKNDGYRRVTLSTIEFGGVGVQYIDTLRMYSADPSVDDVLAEGFYTGNGKASLQLNQTISIPVGGEYKFFLTIDIDPVTPTGSLIRVDHDYAAQGKTIQVFWM